MKTGICADCGEWAAIVAKGYCSRCYGRNYRAMNEKACRECTDRWRKRHNIKDRRRRLQAVKVYHESLIRKYLG